DIEDEHDEVEAAHIIKDPKLGLISAARMPVKELESYLGMKLLKPEEEEDIDTLGGLVFALVGRVPARGELVRHPSGLEFEILDADPRRVKKLRVHPPRAANEGGPPAKA
ncbi:MAG: transporter associated domain-containing protein, partial [Hyphomicrobiaceae bacterium]